MATEIDAGLKEMASSEMEELDSQFLQLEEQIKRNLLKGDNEDDGGSAILEIRAGSTQ